MSKCHRLSSDGILVLSRYEASLCREEFRSIVERTEFSHDQRTMLTVRKKLAGAARTQQIAIVRSHFVGNSGVTAATNDPVSRIAIEPIGAEAFFACFRCHPSPGFERGYRPNSRYRHHIPLSCTTSYICSNYTRFGL